MCHANENHLSHKSQLESIFLLVIWQKNKKIAMYSVTKIAMYSVTENQGTIQFICDPAPYSFKTQACRLKKSPMLLSADTSRWKIWASYHQMVSSRQENINQNLHDYIVNMYTRKFANITICGYHGRRGTACHLLVSSKPF